MVLSLKGRIIRMLVSIFVLMLTVVVILANIISYARDYGWLCLTCIIFYIIGVAAFMLLFASIYIITKHESTARRCFVFSFILYLIAAIVCILDEGFKGDFYPLLIFYSAVVAVLYLTMNYRAVAWTKERMRILVDIAAHPSFGGKYTKLFMNIGGFASCLITILVVWHRARAGSLHGGPLSLVDGLIVMLSTFVGAAIGAVPGAYIDGFRERKK